MILPANDETFWSHLEVAGTILVPLLLFWFQSMRSAQRNHVENVTRLTRIETTLEPIARWWNRSKEQ